MTPEEARVVQDARLSAGWDWCPDDMHDPLEEDMLATIAAQTWEYGVEHLGHVSRWGSRESAEDDFSYYFRTGSFIPRLVRRLAGPVEVAE